MYNNIYMYLATYRISSNTLPLPLLGTFFCMLRSCSYNSRAGTNQGWGLSTHTTFLLHFNQNYLHVYRLTSIARSAYIYWGEPEHAPHKQYICVPQYIILGEPHSSHVNGQRLLCRYIYLFICFSPSFRKLQLIILFHAVLVVEMLYSLPSSSWQVAQLQNTGIYT